MEVIKEIFDKFKGVFIWWLVVMPWEEALIIRNGKRIRYKKKGVHFKIPYIDRCFVQCVRTRTVQSAPQTITNNDGENVTICVSVNYAIEDLNKLYANALEPEQMIVNALNGEVYKAAIDSISIDRDLLDAGCRRFGVKIESLNIITEAKTRTYRLIQDNHYVQDSERLNEFIK